jgi:integrase
LRRQKNRLTAVDIRNAKRDTCDGQGLWLQVSPKFGTKSWLFRFTDPIFKKADSMGFGAVDRVSLAKARELAQKARDVLAEGNNPRLERDAQRTAKRVETAKRMTFVACAGAYIRANEAGWKSAVHRAQWRSTFNETRRGSRVFPAATAAINDLPVAAIDVALVIKVLEPIWYATPESASRIRGRIERVLAWATVAGHRTGDNPARWGGNLNELLPAKNKIAKTEHHNAVPYRELPKFMADLRAKPGVSARALEFCVLTATRTGEVIGARWDEIDLETKVWSIPAKRMKSGRPHTVPLSNQALEIIANLPRECEYLFSGRAAGKPLSNMAMLELLRDMRGKGATVHGFRSSLRDWAGNETNFPREIAEAALAHVVGDETERSYRRSDALEKRRKLMSAWAAYCERALADRRNVISIRETA